MTTYTISLPWPPKELSSNFTGKLRDKLRAKKMHRQAAFWLTKEQRVPCIPDASLTFTYYPPDRRARDCQNMPHSVKAAIDGIAAAMKCDDKLFRCRFPDSFAEVVQNGKIIIEIRGLE